MATILEFRASSEKPPRKIRRRPRRSAEIVIFPGVRYERWPAPQAIAEPQAQPAPAATPAARDKRQLGD